MKLAKCPKCYSEAYENLPSYSICHDCNYNSVEGYAWGGKSHDPKEFIRMKIRKEGFPLDAEDRKTFLNGVVSRYIFLPEDQEIVRQSIQSLRPLDRSLIYFKFWLEFPTEKIASLVGLPAWKVDSMLLEIYAYLKDECLENPNFSTNRIRRTVEGVLMPQAG